MGDIKMDEAWKTNVKAMFDLYLQDNEARISSERTLQGKLTTMFLDNQQHLDTVKIQAANSAQLLNAIISAAAVESVLGRATSEQTIEGKLAAQFPASVTEMVTLITDKLVNMVGVDALLAVVNAVVKGKAEVEEE